MGRFFVYFGLVFWFMDDIINKKSSATGAFVENFIPLSCSGVVFAILIRIASKDKCKVVILRNAAVIKKMTVLGEADTSILSY